MFGRKKAATSLHLFKEKEFMRYMPGSESFRDYMMWIRPAIKRIAAKKTVYKTRTILVPRSRCQYFQHLFPWALETHETVVQGFLKKLVGPDDMVVEGEIETGKRYTEPDFNKIIEIKEREKKRVEIFMQDINQQQKTLVGTVKLIKIIEKSGEFIS